MDSKHSSSSSRARVPQITNGDMLADRARALVDRTRAGLGTRGLSVKTCGGLGVKRSDEYPGTFPDYDLDFVDELTSIRAEHLDASKNMTVQFRQRELTAIVDGVSRLLDSIGVMDPAMVARVAKCQKLLNEILSGASFESDSDSESSDGSFNDFEDAANQSDGEFDADGFKKEPDFQSKARRVAPREAQSNTPIDWPAVRKAKRTKWIRNPDKKSNTDPNQG